MLKKSLPGSLPGVFLGGLALSVSFLSLSCNLLFLDLGYKNKEPEIEAGVDFTYPGWGPTTEQITETEFDGLLWPQLSFTVSDDLGVARLSCHVVSDDGAGNFVIENSLPASRYVWSDTRQLADVLGFGTNAITVTVTDSKGLTAEYDVEFNAFADVSSLGAYFGSDKADVYLWHAGGIASASYAYASDNMGTTLTSPTTLSDLDDGTSAGGTKLFKGRRSEGCPPGYGYVVFNVMLENGQSIESRYFMLSEGE